MRTIKNKQSLTSPKTIVGIISVCLLIVVSVKSLTGGFTSEKDTPTDTTNQKEEQTTTTAESTLIDLPAVSKDDWSLVLVGPKNKLKTEVDETKLASLSNGYQVDERIADSYEKLAQAAKKADFPLVIISAFRSVAYQQTVFDRNVQAVMTKNGVSEEDAIVEVKKTVTEPGYSEHHTGLAVDVVDESWYNNYPDEVLEESFGSQPGAKWLAKNAPDYGFIVRYPKGKEKITMIDYEPWHLRYVGEESAKYITKNNLTLEEYLNLL